MTQENRQARRAAERKAKDAPRIELPIGVSTRWEAFNIGDLEIQHNWAQAYAAGETEAGFIKRAMYDLEQLEAGRAERDRLVALDKANEHQGHRIAVGGLVLQGLLAGNVMGKDASIHEHAVQALAIADALLAEAEETKDPVLNQ